MQVQNTHTHVTGPGNVKVQNTHTRTWTRVMCRYRTQATRKQMQNTSRSRTATLL